MVCSCVLLPRRQSGSSKAATLAGFCFDTDLDVQKALHEGNTALHEGNTAGLGNSEMLLVLQIPSACYSSPPPTNEHHEQQIPVAQLSL